MPEPTFSDISMIRVPVGTLTVIETSVNVSVALSMVRPLFQRAAISAKSTSRGAARPVR